MAPCWFMLNLLLAVANPLSIGENEIDLKVYFPFYNICCKRSNEGSLLCILYT